jgi:hypothetical protein
MTRTKRDIIKDTAIFSECDFSLGAAVQVVKDGFRHASPGDGPKVLDTDDAGRCY